MPANPLAGNGGGRQISGMTDESSRLLLRQLDTAWRLLSFHLDGLTTPECLWRPADRGLHVWRDESGVWRADWPEHEGYDLGPPSIAWITWHVIFWWRMVLDHSFGNGRLRRENVVWPGGAEDVRGLITDLHGQWRSAIEEMTGDDLRSDAHTRWPFTSRPFGDVAAWVNLELTKNAAEIGYARFLYATRSPSQQ